MKIDKIPMAMDLNKISNCSLLNFDFMYSTNANNWHNPNVPKANMCSDDCTGWKPTNDICILKIVPTQ